jgi:hypothetical protein
MPETCRAQRSIPCGAIDDAVERELELMLDASDGEEWVFRRDARIACVLSSAIRRNPEGIAFLSPEIQFLYRARATRAQDQADFDHVDPHLNQDARTWLRQSRKCIEPVPVDQSEAQRLRLFGIRVVLRPP